MKEDFFLKVGYTTYLQKPKTKKESWTSRIYKKIMEHKILSISFLLISMCVIMNFCLIYQFIHILESSRIY